MLAIELRFRTGLFHATPWGRNVNEGVVEWPPSPYRLARAIYDTWKRKRPDWPEERVEPLLAAIASEPPRFRLPPASASHVRLFMNSNTKNPEDKQRIFDAFVVLQPQDPVTIGWSGVNLDSMQTKDLNELLGALNYFGRSESWVDACALTDPAVTWNSFPANGSIDKGYEIVRVACPMPREEFQGARWTEAIGKRMKGRARQEQLRWIDSLTWSTDDLLEYGLSAPPSLKLVDYAREAGCLGRKPVPRGRSGGASVDCVVYALVSKAPPLATCTIEVAERVRRKLMGIHKRLAGSPALVSSKFSGKDESGSPAKGHRHVYIIPLDADSDGRLDHLIVSCKEPFDEHERAALNALRSIWQPDGRPDITCVLVQFGRRGELMGTKPAKRFVSATPFVTSRHYRRGRGDFFTWLAEEVKREAVYHGFPVPVRVSPVEALAGTRRQYRWTEFRRNRKDDSPRMGYGFELEFAEPVAGPVVLGYGAHFGLGLFLPAPDDKTGYAYGSRSTE
jgi:CRISPR-associated protein Csb2